jgi:hypothetical protein
LLNEETSSPLFLHSENGSRHQSLKSEEYKPKYLELKKLNEIVIAKVSEF